MDEGLSRLMRLKTKGCCLVGPTGYYRRFGFRNYPGLIHEEVPQEVFLSLSFTNEIPTGAAAFHEAFHAEG